jgi:hypothetical protein
MSKPPFKITYDFSQHDEDRSTARGDEHQIAAMLEALDRLRDEIHSLGEQTDQERILRDQRESRDRLVLVAAFIAAIPGIVEIVNLLS